MSITLIITIIVGYFFTLMAISFWSSKNTTEESFYTGDKSSPWYLVAFGMIGASLSGVTFVSVPGEVGNSAFSYFAMVLGYIPGYLIVSYVLLPIYYKSSSITIYGFLEKKVGFWSYQTGSIFFLLSRIIGASFRLFIVAGVLQIALFDSLGIPFWISVLVTIVLIWTYTIKGGIKTIVFTDTLQTFFMVGSVVVCLFSIANAMDLSMIELVKATNESDLSKVFFWDGSAKNFFKLFFAGVFIVIAMTGLDQDMMQKNLTCRNLKDAQKNMMTFSVVLIFVNLIFLTLGAALFLYFDFAGLEALAKTDQMFPTLAIHHLKGATGIFFLLGIIAAAYSSADSALTSLTTTFCVDILNIKKHKNPKNTRFWVHIGFSLVLFFTILLFSSFNDDSIVVSVFKAAGYTYGPILGLYLYAIIGKRPNCDIWVLPWCIVCPIICYFIQLYSPTVLNYTFGFELLILNGLLTAFGIWVGSMIIGTVEE